MAVNAVYFGNIFENSQSKSAKGHRQEQWVLNAARRVSKETPPYVSPFAVTFQGNPATLKAKDAKPRLDYIL